MYEKGGMTAERFLEFLQKHIFPKYKGYLIGTNKVDEGCRQLNKKLKQKVLFYFQFTDGLFYYELNPNDLSGYGDKSPLRRDYFKGKSYYFIPVELLCRTEVKVTDQV